MPLHYFRAYQISSEMIKVGPLQKTLKNATWVYKVKEYTNLLYAFKDTL